MRWSHPDVVQTVGPSALRVTMLRHPLDQYVSMWGYYSLGRPKTQGLTIDEYVKKVDSLDRISARGGNIKASIGRIFLRTNELRYLKWQVQHWASQIVNYTDQDSLIRINAIKHSWKKT